MGCWGHAPSCQVTECQGWQASQTCTATGWTGDRPGSRSEPVTGPGPAGVTSPERSPTGRGSWYQLCTSPLTLHPLPQLILCFQSRILFGASLGGASYLWLLKLLQQFINIERIPPRGLGKEFSLLCVRARACVCKKGRECWKKRDAR